MHTSRIVLRRMRVVGSIVAFVGFWLVTAPSSARADAAPAVGAPGEPLVVGVREAPPFAMREASGEWTGLSVELWEAIAAERGWAFSWRELPLDQTLDALEAETIDVAIAALTVTEERARSIDFSHPYHVGGLATAWRAQPGAAWVDPLASLPWRAGFGVIGPIFLALLGAGGVVWLFERRANPDQFGGPWARGLLGAFWWAAVTMTTVGYGDKAPRSLGGRLAAVLWMFAGIGIIASLTGEIAASVTVRRLETDLLRSRALSELRVGVLAESSAAAYAAERGARPSGLLRTDGGARGPRGQRGRRGGPRRADPPPRGALHGRSALRHRSQDPGTR